MGLKWGKVWKASGCSPLAHFVAFCSLACFFWVWRIFWFFPPCRPYLCKECLECLYSPPNLMWPPSCPSFFPSFLYRPPSSNSLVKPSNYLKIQFTYPVSLESMTHHTLTISITHFFIHVFIQSFDSCAVSTFLFLFVPLYVSVVFSVGIDEILYFYSVSYFVSSEFIICYFS